MASRCVRKQVTLVTALARPPDTFGCSQPAHQAGLGAAPSFCASLRRAGVSRGSSVCPPQHQSKQDKRTEVFGAHSAPAQAQQGWVCLSHCLQAAGLSTTSRCCFRAAGAAAISPPTPSPGALHHFKACCALFQPSSFPPPTQAGHRRKAGVYPWPRAAHAAQ